MADRCVCGHEEREHDRGDAMGDECHVCGCEDYRRSPLSAFRGPAVRFTREEAAGWLRALGRYWEAARIEGSRVGPRERLSMVRRLLVLARGAIRFGATYAAGERYLAARILRAVRP